MVHKLIITTVLVLTSLAIQAQPQIIDEVVAVVGDNPILRSDIEKEFETLREQLGKDMVDDTMRIDILDQLISKKLMLYQAQLDSVIIPDERVEAEMEQKLNYILAHFGGDEKKLEDYLGSTVVEFKSKTKPKIKEQMLISQMESQIINDVKVTPAEVRKYFASIPKDSLPPIPAELEIGQIVIRPKVSQFAKDYAKERAEGLRKRLLEGADFSTLAQQYSDDPGSSGKGGELGFFKRGKMVPEFEAAAFRLEKDSFSKVVETAFGYHILQLIERRGGSVNIRHILIAPKMINSDYTDAYNKIDSIRTAIISGSITFEEAAKLYSDEEGSASKGGLLSDYTTGSTKIPVSQLDKNVYLAIKDLKPGQMTTPTRILAQDQKEVFVFYKLVSETEPHMPSMETDYLKIQNAALEQKKSEAMDVWLVNAKKKYSISISQRYIGEPELAHWFEK